MRPSKPFTLPRAKIDVDQQDHDPSAIAFNAPLPRAKETDSPTPDPPTFPNSKIGRRQWTDDTADPWQFNAWSVSSSPILSISCLSISSPPPSLFFACRDNVEWNEEQQKFAEDTTTKQAANPVPDDMKSGFPRFP
jgi:hypothetical protein